MTDVYPLPQTQHRILVIDDEDAPREALGLLLRQLRYSVDLASSGADALRLLIRATYDTILLDINMPGMNGFEVLTRIRELDPLVPIVFLTSEDSMQSVIRAFNLGAYDYIQKPIQYIEILNRKLLRAIEKKRYDDFQKAFIRNLEEKVRETTALLEEYSRKLEDDTVSIISSLQVALEKKDLLTAGHTTRVTELSGKLGAALECSQQEINMLIRGAQLHDIGKLVIDLSCIQKETRLTSDEWNMIRQHPEVGAAILEPLGYLSREIEVVKYHHEKVDGTGYPCGLRKPEIPFLTRIVTVADSYDAMVSRRSYKPSRSAADAINELRRCTGTQFDGDAVSALVMILRKSGQLGKNE